MALCGAAGIWAASWVIAGCCGQTPNDAAGVRTPVETNVFEIERHGVTRRGAALLVRCATPLSVFEKIYTPPLTVYPACYKYHKPPGSLGNATVKSILSVCMCSETPGLCPSHIINAYGEYLIAI